MAGLLSRIFRRGGETKTAVSAPVSSASSPSALFASQFLSAQEIVPWHAWLLYLNSSTFSKVANLIADEVARLQPQVKIDGEIVSDTPIHAILKRPGRGRDRKGFIKDLAIQQLVTGTAYPIVHGNPNVPDPRQSVIMIEVAKTQYVRPTQATSDMWPDSYWYSEGTRQVTFYRDPTNPRDFAWRDATGLAQLFPIYEMDGAFRGVGLSRLNAIKHDVELRLKGIQHNASVLDNGARPSAIANYKQELTPEQRDDARAQFQALGAGAQNAGKILVTSGGEMEFTQLSQSMKDMDFAKLIETVEDAIASAYNVPVTLFRTSAQTNNNYATAWETFYYLAVLPCFETIYGGLARMFSERYGVDIEITHDALTNPVLAKAAVERGLKLYGGHLVSRNEAREICGFEPVLGGDTIYGSVGDVPQAEDYFTNHGINDPSQRGLQDNSLQAYHETRPDANPVNRAAAEEGARTEARVAAQGGQESGQTSGQKPAQQTDKPTKKPDKKPDKKSISDDAFGHILAFADGLKSSSARGAMNGRRVA